MGKFEPVWSDEAIEVLRARHADGESLRALSEESGVPRSTLQRRFKQAREAEANAALKRDRDRQRRKTTERHLADRRPMTAEETEAWKARTDPKYGGRGRRKPGGRVRVIALGGNPDYERWLDDRDEAREAVAAYLATGAADRIYTHNGRALITTSRENATEKGLPIFAEQDAAVAALAAELEAAAALPEPPAPPLTTLHDLFAAEEAATA